MERLEDIIRRNIGAFYVVGHALMEIRDKKYYREVLGFETFEAYCNAKWDFRSDYARRLIASAETVDNVKNAPMGAIPTSERQVRPLLKLKDTPDQQLIAWQKAVETAPNGKVTAAEIVQPGRS